MKTSELVITVGVGIGVAVLAHYLTRPGGPLENPGKVLTDLSSSASSAVSSLTGNTPVDDPRYPYATKEVQAQLLSGNLSSLFKGPSVWGAPPPLVPGNRGIVPPSVGGINISSISSTASSAYDAASDVWAGASDLFGGF